MKPQENMIVTIMVFLKELIYLTLFFLLISNQTSHLILSHYLLLAMVEIPKFRRFEYV